MLHAQACLLHCWHALFQIHSFHALGFARHGSSVTPTKFFEFHLFWKAMSMKQVADWALDTAKQRGAQYADARIVNDRSSSLATKNGKVGHASSAESLGIGVRVLL